MTKKLNHPLPLELRPHVRYEITNTINGKKYTGITWEPDVRWSTHKTVARSNKEGEVIQKAMRKHGIQNFVFTIVEHFPDRKSAAEAEIIAIATKQYPYCVSPGGDGGSGLHTEETKKKISAKLKGLKRTPEQIERYRQMNLGRKQSPEAIEKSAASRRGKPMKEETKEKLRIANTGKKRTPEQVEKNRQAQLGTKQTRERIEHRVSLLKGQKRTSEQLARMSAGQQERVKREKEQRLNKSEQLSQEMREVISKKLTGIKRSPETIEKLKQAWVKRKAKNMPGDLSPDSKPANLGEVVQQNLPEDNKEK